MADAKPNANPTDKRTVSGECPNCGIEALYSERASGEGAELFNQDRQVKAGQRVTRCDVCSITLKAGSASKPKPARKPKRRSKAARKPKRSSARSRK